jgi:hypothetical protein
MWWRGRHHSTRLPGPTACNRSRNLKPAQHPLPNPETLPLRSTADIRQRKKDVDHCHRRLNRKRALSGVGRFRPESHHLRDSWPECRKYPSTKASGISTTRGSRFWSSIKLSCPIFFLFCNGLFIRHLPCFFSLIIGFHTNAHNGMGQRRNIFWAVEPKRHLPNRSGLLSP